MLPTFSATAHCSAAHIFLHLRMRRAHKLTVFALICLVASLTPAYILPILTANVLKTSFLPLNIIPVTALRLPLHSSAPLRLPFETISISEASAKHPQRLQLQHNLSIFLDIIVTQYTIWHREQRRLCEANATHAHSLPILVLRITKDNGIGDRIRAILYNYLAAAASKRFFLLDFQVPLPLTNVLRSTPTDNYTYDATLFTSSSEEEFMFKGPPYFRSLDMHLSEKRVLVDDVANAFDFKGFRRVYHNYRHLDMIRKIREAGLKDFRPQRELVAPFILKALFETTPSLRKSLEDLLPFDGQPYVSVHARLGHGIHESSGRFNFTEQGHTLPSLAHCIGSLAAVRAQQLGHERVYVVTDTMDAREFIEDGVRFVAPRIEIAHSPINATHFHNLHVNGDFPDEKERRQKFEEVFVDLGLLSLAKSIIYFRSGFPIVAAWFGGITDSVMVNYDDCALIQEGNLTATELFPQRLLSVMYS
eukprot:TRINITY_DN1938_c0_g1_i1.p1 TRINITY_DN1938_c0_g1~~TRINITY_DN1938_c0_g1_i1.p1  ORF type:complete len:477 (-),score=45.44 TRINITY_DN1938_c0_g1_i1:184-1614(-)